MKTHYIFKLNWIFLFSLIFVYVENDLFGFSTISDDNKNFVVSEGEIGSDDNGYLQINFVFPETVEAGQIFTFEFVIAKTSEHSIGGEFQFTWPNGFAPLVSDNPNAKCKVDKNKILVEWNPQSFTGDIKIDYPVQVNNATSGVYPILSILTFTGGLQIQKNAKIRVDVNKSGILPNHTINATIGSCSVVLKYQREVEFGTKFDLGIMVDKGNMKGVSHLNISIPPNSDMKVLNHEEFEYNKQTGKLKLIWKKLPENSTINVNCEVICNTTVKAVYPISAEFFVDEKLNAFFSNSIYVTDKPIVISQRSAEQTKREQASQKADSIKLYAEMDELLNQWKNATKVITVETGKENLLPENQKADANRKVVMETINSPEPKIQGATKTVPEVAMKTETLPDKTVPEAAKKTEPQVEKKAAPEVAKKSGPVANKTEEPKKEIVNPEKKPTENAQAPVTLPAAKNIENTQKQQVQTDKSALADTQLEGPKMYRVQIAASKTPLPGTKQFIRSLGFFEILTEDFDGTWYRYFIGEFSQIAEAKDFNKTLVEKGITDSFIVTFIDGKRVTSN